MLFLQSVTKHADKLKQSGESKVKPFSEYLKVTYHVFAEGSWNIAHKAF